MVKKWNSKNGPALLVLGGRTRTWHCAATRGYVNSNRDFGDGLSSYLKIRVCDVIGSDVIEVEVVSKTSEVEVVSKTSRLKLFQRQAG